MNRIALVFPGLGSHFIGMGKLLYEQYPIAKSTFDEASDVLGTALHTLCFEGSIRELSKPVHAQAAIMTVSIAASRVYMKEIGIKPFIVAGHSFGEYAALVYAGVIEFSEALKLVKQRGILAEKIVQEKNSGMTIIDNIPFETVQQICKEQTEKRKQVYITCYNTPLQCTIAGYSDAMLTIERHIRSKGGKTTPLLRSAPYHCGIMKETADEYLADLDACNYSEMRLPVLSNVNALPYNHTIKPVQMLYRHMTNPVQWLSIMEWMEAHTVTTVIEMGPQRILCNLAEQVLPYVSTYAFGQSDDRERLFNIMLRNQTEEPAIKLNPGGAFLASCLSAAVSTRNENQNLQEYKKEVLHPYEEIRKTYEDVISGKTEANTLLLKRAFDNLKRILDNKKIQPDEKNNLIEKILCSAGYKDFLQ